MIGQESHGRDHKRRPHEACLQGGLSPGYDLPGIDINIVDSTIQGTIIGSENRLEIHSLRNKELAFIVWSFFQVNITYFALFVKILLELLIQLFCLVAFDCWKQPMLLGIL